MLDSDPLEETLERISSIGNQREFSLESLRARCEAGLSSRGTIPRRILVNSRGWSALQSTYHTVNIDKYGPHAAIVTGEMAKIFGIPVVVNGGQAADFLLDYGNEMVLPL